MFALTAMVREWWMNHLLVHVIFVPEDITRAIHVTVTGKRHAIVVMKPEQQTLLVAHVTVLVK